MWKNAAVLVLRHENAVRVGNSRAGATTSPPTGCDWRPGPGRWLVAGGGRSSGHAGHPARLAPHTRSPKAGLSHATTYRTPTNSSGGQDARAAVLQGEPAVGDIGGSCGA